MPSDSISLVYFALIPLVVAFWSASVFSAMRAAGRRINPVWGFGLALDFALAVAGVSIWAQGKGVGLASWAIGLVLAAMMLALGHFSVRSGAQRIAIPATL